VLDEFLLESVRAGFSCVRVIHGRGRHSHVQEFDAVFPSRRRARQNA
jgi:hypothetical protein